MVSRYGPPHLRPPPTPNPQRCTMLNFPVNNQEYPLSVEDRMDHEENQGRESPPSETLVLILAVVSWGVVVLSWCGCYFSN